MRSNEGAGLASQRICGISNFPLYRKIVLIQTWGFANHRRGFARSVAFRSQASLRARRRPFATKLHDARWWAPCEVRRPVARISAALRFEQNTDHDIGLVFTVLRLRGVRDISRWLTSRPRDRRSVDDSVSIKCDWSTNLPLNQWFYATIAPKIARACPIMRVADFPIRAFVEASAWYIRGKDGNDHLFKTWVHSVWPCGVVFRTDSARRCARGCRSRRHGQGHEQRLDARLRLSNLQSGAG